MLWHLTDWYCNKILLKKILLNLLNLTNQSPSSSTQSLFCSWLFFQHHISTLHGSSELLRLPLSSPALNCLPLVVKCSCRLIPFFLPMPSPYPAACYFLPSSHVKYSVIPQGHSAYLVCTPLCILGEEGYLHILFLIFNHVFLHT